MTNSLKKKRNYHKKQTKKVNKSKNKKVQHGGAYYRDNESQLQDIFASFMKQKRIVKRKLDRSGLTSQDFYKETEITKKNNNDYLENVRGGLNAFLSDPRSNVFSFLCLHGKYFDSSIYHGEINYFIVPSNIIICILTPPDTFSVNYRIKKPYEVWKDKMFEAMIKYRGKLKEEAFFYEKSNSFNCELTDYFKFSSWFYPGQLCHNFSLSLSEKEYHERKNENFELYEQFTKQIKYGTRLRDGIYKKFYKPGLGIQLQADSLLKCYNPTYKYFIMIESCNITNVNSSSPELIQNIYKMHHLNQWVVQTIENKTPVPPVEETFNFKYQGIRTALQSLYRHTQRNIFDSSAPDRLHTFLQLTGEKLEYPIKIYKFELFYEIIEKLGGSYTEVTDMQEYFKFLKNLSIFDMLKFIILLNKNQEKFTSKNLLYLLSNVFGEDHFLHNFNEKKAQIFQVIRAMNNKEGSRGLRDIAFKKKQLYTILSNCIVMSTDIQRFLNRIYPKGQAPDLSSIRGIIDVLDTQVADKYKYYIHQNNNVTTPAILLEHNVDTELISTLLIKNTTKLPDNVDVRKYRFDYLEIKKSDTTNFDDATFEYNLAYFHIRKLEVLVENSLLIVNPSFNLLGFTKVLYIDKPDPRQTKLRIGHFFHNLQSLRVGVSKNLSKIEIENNKVEKIIIKSCHPETMEPIIRVRGLNLKYFTLDGVSSHKLFFHTCRNIQELEFKSLHLYLDRFHQISKYIPVLKKLIIMDCKVISEGSDNKLSIPPRLEDITIYDLGDARVEFSKTNLREVKHMSMIAVKLDIEGIFSSRAKFSKEKLEYLYVILDNSKLSDRDRKPFYETFYELEDYLESIGSRIADRTCNDSEYDKYFT